MYINFWYPAVLSTELGDQPQKIRMLGLDFVVYRDTGGSPHCLSDTCTHRGGSLSGGKVRGDCIQCPYHGWEYNGQGEVKRIPSLGLNPHIPGRTHIDAYPVCEKYGLVFVFLGDLPADGRPPMMEIPEFDSPEWRPTWLNFQAPINYERSIENGLDPAHNEFVHPTHGFSGENTEYKVNDLRWVGNGTWGPGFFHRFKSPQSQDKEWAEVKKASDSREAGSGTIGPSHMWTYIRYGEGRAMHQYLYECPIDATHTNIYLVNMRNTFIEPEMDEKFNARNWAVISQDLTVLKDIRPRMTPATNTKEFMLPADQPSLRYREKLKEWEALGWRIDIDSIARARNRVAYAIPSPERRIIKGWVIDPVPLIKPADVNEGSASARREAG
jgi:phenylpropionate dioxygenase-like ring-hydroxylating dioxygenase large terminal subunit